MSIRRPVTVMEGAGGGVASSHGDAGTKARCVYTEASELVTAPPFRLSVVFALYSRCPVPFARCRVRVTWLGISLALNADAVPSFTRYAARPGQTWRPITLSPIHQSSSAG